MGAVKRRRARRSGRRRVSVLALLSGVATATTGAALGGSGLHLYAAALYVALTVIVLRLPATLPAQVIAGQALIAAVLLTPDGPPALLALPLVATLVLTAELLGVAARLDLPTRRDPEADLGRSFVAAVIGAAAWGAVVLVAAVPGPAGLTGVVLGSLACILLAVVLVRSSARTGRGARSA